MPESRADPPKAIVFDVDGTLYRQGPVRRAMLGRIVRAHVTQPRLGIRTARVLSAYRHAQAQLRASGTPSADLGALQIGLAADCTHTAPGFVAACVARWMDKEPLDLVARFAYPGLTELLDRCRAQGIRLGILSDYPAEAKVAALGIRESFDVVVTAQAPDVGVFKPQVRGLLRVLDRLGASPSESLYVGDRPEVDGAIAVAIGMACVILTSRRGQRRPVTWTEVRGYRELQQRLFHGTSNEHALAVS